ncbi:hypothetical protein Plhal710r2_c011g0051851 [Plasmopara halstedii]
MTVMRRLYLYSILLIGVIAWFLLIFMARRLENQDTSIPIPPILPASDNHASPRRALQHIAARDDDKTNVKKKIKEERVLRSLWNEILYKFAWKSEIPSNYLRDSQHNWASKLNEKNHIWLRRFARFIARRDIGDKRVSQLLKNFGDTNKAVVEQFFRLRLVDGFSDVADAILGKLARNPEFEEPIFLTYLANRLRYIDLYRDLDATGFSDDEMFRLMTNNGVDKIKIKVVIQTLFALIKTDPSPSEKNVMSDMIFYMATNQATWENLLSESLKEKVPSQTVFLVLRLNQPGFDLKLFERWIMYDEKRYAGITNSDFKLKIEKKFASMIDDIADNKLKYAFNSFREEMPASSRTEIAKLSVAFVKMQVNPRDYFFSLHLINQIDAQNIYFQRWLCYAFVLINRGEFTRTELIDFLREFKSEAELVKVLSDFRTPYLIEYADKILLTLASYSTVKDEVYTAWEVSNKSPEYIFKHVLEKKIGVDAEFIACLGYIELCRVKHKEWIFNELDLYLTLRENEVNSVEAVVNTFHQLLIKNDPETSAVVKRRWQSRLDPQFVFDLWCHVPPNFDDEFLDLWTQYYTTFRKKYNEASDFLDYNLEMWLIIMRSKPKLRSILETLQEDLVVKKFADIALEGLNFLDRADQWLSDGKSPEEVWTIMSPDVQVDSENKMFRRWIRYVNKCMGKGYTIEQWNDFVFEKSKKKEIEVVTLLRSLLNYEETGVAAKQLLWEMASNPTVSSKVFDLWKDLGEDPYEFFELLDLRQICFKTFARWLEYLEVKRPLTNFEEEFNAMCMKISDRRQLSQPVLRILLKKIQSPPKVKAFAEDLLRVSRSD